MILTSRQLEVAQLYSDGLGTGEISKKLGIERPTVKAHLTHIYKKLEMRGTRIGGRDQQRMRLALYWNCELFQIGLNAA